MACYWIGVYGELEWQRAYSGLPGALLGALDSLDAALDVRPLELDGFALELDTLRNDLTLAGGRWDVSLAEIGVLLIIFTYTRAAFICQWDQ